MSINENNNEQVQKSTNSPEISSNLNENSTNSVTTNETNPSITNPSDLSSSNNETTSNNSSSVNSSTANSTHSSMNHAKRKELSVSDFYFGSLLGEGAYARVLHARLKCTTNNGPPLPDYAVKIMDKSHIVKENKVKYVMMEKNILSKVSHPFIIK